MFVLVEPVHVLQAPCAAIRQSGTQCNPLACALRRSVGPLIDYSVDGVIFGNLGVSGLTSIEDECMRKVRATARKFHIEAKVQTIGYANT